MNFILLFFNSLKYHLIEILNRKGFININNTNIKDAWRHLSRLLLKMQKISKMHFNRKAILIFDCATEKLDK